MLKSAEKLMLKSAEKDVASSDAGDRDSRLAGVHQRGSCLTPTPTRNTNA